MDSYTRDMFAGVLVFLSILFLGMYILYDNNGVIQKQPFIQHLFNGNGSTVGPSLFSYYEIINFFFWFLIIPLSLILFIIFPARRESSKGKGGFHR